MSFTSLNFIFFLVPVIILFYIVPSKIQWYVLLAASVSFYAFFGLKSAGLMIVSAVVGYGSARFIAALDGAKRKAMLALAILLEIAVLLCLKYSGEIRESLKLVVPIGISFYTLSIIGYLIDVYRGKYCAEKNILRFLLFVLYFPHILQGPIPRYDGLRSQFFPESRVRYNHERVTKGIQLMLWGYIKKLVIADRIAVFVNTVYDSIPFQRGTVIFLAAILYSVQIYMDFSGCVDIAMGVSELFAINLTPNFRQPYLASSINDFWRRWHISLSTWFRDYLYIPLGGNRKGAARRWINMMLVFTVSGFWHGVGISYVVWGLLQGLYQLAGHALMPVRKAVRRLLRFNESRQAFRWLQIVITFGLVSIAWVFFRLPNVRLALGSLKAMAFDFSPWVFSDGTLLNYGISTGQWHILLVFILGALIVDILHERGVRIRDAIGKQHLLVRWGVYLFALVAIILWGVYGIGYDMKSFIYMEF